MPMKVRYYVINGEMIGDSVTSEYMRDALGSVTGTISSTTGIVANTYRYKPYGARLAKTGTATEPKFQWVGTAGYRNTSLAHSTQYVRARHYGEGEGRWTTIDPLWPDEHPFAYVNSSPVFKTDYTGLADCPSSWPACPDVELIAKLKDGCLKDGSDLCNAKLDTAQTLARWCPVCCGNCYKTCRPIVQLGGKLCLKTDPPGQLKCAMESIKPWLKKGEEINKRVPPKIDPSKNCPPCTPPGVDGYHYQWQCKPASKGVITASCCPCYHQGRVLVVCYTSQGCHNNRR